MKKAGPQNTILFFTLFVFTIATSCVSKKNTLQNTAAEEVNPKLIFLNYSISEDSKGKKSIQFINKIIADGKLKKSMHVNKVAYGDLICQQLDKNLNVLQSITIKNPLVKTFEYVDDSNQFQRKKMVLKKAEFSLKLKFEPKAEYLVIEEIKSSGAKTEPLIKTKIAAL